MDICNTPEILDLSAPALPGQITLKSMESAYLWTEKDVQLRMRGSSGSGKPLNTTIFILTHVKTE